MVKDATGEQFTFERAPKRIISLSPAETESLFVLGLNSEIVGVSDYDDYPRAAKFKEKMGGITKPNEEAIIKAKPDIVFTGISMKEPIVKKLRELGIPLFKVEPKTYDDVIRNIELYGQITDHQAEANTVIDHIKQVRASVRTAVRHAKKKKVYVEFSPGWTVGSGEFMNELIELAGGVNVASDRKGWFQISEEKIIQASPDIILYTQHIVDKDTHKSLKETICERSGWNKIRAIQHHQLFGIHEDLISRPGPRIADGLKTIAAFIHPDLVQSSLGRNQ